MELGECKTVGNRAPVRPIPEPDTAAKFLANTLANIASWRAAEGAREPSAGASEEVAARFTPKEFELVARLLADDASPTAMRLLDALANDAEERLGDVSTGEWLPLKSSDVLSEPHSSVRSSWAWTPTSPS
ncbi:hypothetical protein I5Q34_21915 [Streptomyces sp. AV19]|uniref:hypothetical protein n=1 Tax=Streptomyces sp. AV19 TaxID=2793068 RepID=UPI0018FECD0C|nr:hypothetical protein [Streptomyces sp. AV19]MBH1936892.1 hypothetical protein [Streptomyces sp. AV19]MDG4532933.1 hypothetical protein [Streptomyces sp. AV19]